MYIIPNIHKLLNLVTIQAEQTNIDHIILNSVSVYEAIEILKPIFLYW